ncbi:hypothetical protein QR680_010678 [Steinernema hermaphroditum]|uniref:Uncharacterized protein n=1 Tax=Steinernema hermaphroditum TaxID=289476 RepID=A0AA39IPS1_9BILA|nr:hypothetical protein QR680_010678 [Steinernema hermaphroditum]
MATVSERKEELRKGVLSSLVCIKEPRVTVSELQKTYQEDFPGELLSRRLADAGYKSFEKFLRAVPEIVFTDANGVKYVAIAKNNNLGADHIRKQVLQTKTDTRNEKKTDRHAPAAKQPEPKVTKEKPTKVKPTKVKPTKVKPTEVKPTEVKPTEVKPTEVKPTEVKPTEVKPTEVKPTEVKPTEVKQQAQQASSSSAAQSSTPLELNRERFCQLLGDMMRRRGSPLPFDCIAAEVKTNYRIDISDADVLKSVLGVGGKKSRPRAVNTACKGLFKAVYDNGAISIYSCDESQSSRYSSRSDLSGGAKQANVTTTPSPLSYEALCSQIDPRPCSHDVELNHDSEMTCEYSESESAAGTADSEMRRQYDAALNDEDFVERISCGDSYYVGDYAYVDFLLHVMHKYCLVPMINDIPGMLATEFNCDIEEICREEEIHDFVEELVSRSDGNLVLFYRNAMGFLTLPENFNGNKYVTLPVAETDEMLSAVDDMLLNTQIDYDMAPRENHTDAEDIMKTYRTTEEDNGTSEDQANVAAGQTVAQAVLLPSGLLALK